MKIKYIIPSIHSTSSSFDLHCFGIPLLNCRTLYDVKAKTTASNIIMTIYGTHHTSLSVVTNIRQYCTPLTLAVTDGATTVIITRRSIFAIATTTPVITRTTRNTRIRRLLSHIAHALVARMSPEHVIAVKRKHIATSLSFIVSGSKSTMTHASAGYRANMNSKRA